MTETRGAGTGARPRHLLLAPLYLLGALLVLLPAALIIARVIWMPFWIPASAMAPTLLAGDYMAVRPVQPDTIRRGDVLVFRHTVHSAAFVMRLVGLPGDRVQMADGRLHLNGDAVDREPAGTFTEVKGPQGPGLSLPRCGNDPVGMGMPCETPRQRETLPGGRGHFTLDLQPDGAQDDTPEFTVPAGHLFFLGDNRDNAFDSRFSQAAGGLGMVPLENVIGRAEWIVFSARGALLADVWNWRGGRFLKGVE